VAVSPMVRGMITLGVFLLPFAAIGLAIAVAGAWRMVQGNSREGLALLPGWSCPPFRARSAGH
jgi:hypothetical protein